MIITAKLWSLPSDGIVLNLNTFRDKNVNVTVMSRIVIYTFKFTTRVFYTHSKLKKKKN